MKTVVRVLITDEEGQILLGRRDHGPGAGQFALFGGKPDPGETIEETGRRETLEETDLELENVEYWKSIVDTGSVPGETWNVHFIRGRGKGTIHLNNYEITEAIKVKRCNFESLDLAFNHREILEEHFGLR